MTVTDRIEKIIRIMEDIEKSCCDHKDTKHIQ